jgi:hypothetical protein
MLNMKGANRFKKISNFFKKWCEQVEKINEMG